MQITIEIKEVFPLKEGDRYPATEQRGSFTYEAGEDTINRIFSEFVARLTKLNEPASAATNSDDIPF